MRRAVLLLALPGCAQALPPGPPPERDLSAFVLEDLSGGGGGKDADPPLGDLSCRRVDQTFAGSPTGWSLLGSTIIDSANQRLLLTNAFDDKAGSAFYASSVAVPSFEVHFTYHIGGGDGGDGLAFVLAKATGLAELAPKGTGQTLGYVGMTGWAVELDTRAGGVGDPAGPHVAFTNAATGAHLVTGTAPFPLDCDCDRTAKIAFTGSQITIRLDDMVVADGAVPGYTAETYYFGFTAATSNANNRHAIKAFKIAIGPSSGCL
jgi:hypothetical protein